VKNTGEPFGCITGLKSILLHFYFVGRIWEQDTRLLRSKLYRPALPAVGLCNQSWQSWWTESGRTAQGYKYCHGYLKQWRDHPTATAHRWNSHLQWAQCGCAKNAGTVLTFWTDAKQRDSPWTWQRQSLLTGSGHFTAVSGGHQLGTTRQLCHQHGDAYYHRTKRFSRRSCVGPPGCTAAWTCRQHSMLQWHLGKYVKTCHDQFLPY
jgi:hypothetical protein